MIRAIFFDLDGTLVDRASTHRRYCLDLMERHPEVFPHLSRQADLRALESGLDDPRLDRRALSRRISSAFPGLGLTPEQVARVKKSYTGQALAHFFNGNGKLNSNGKTRKG